MPRKKKQKEVVNLLGITLAEWREEPVLVKWAQDTPRFRSVLTVLNNTRQDAVRTGAAMSEARRLGIYEGYDIAISVLQLMAKGMEKEPEADDAPTYPIDDTDDAMIFDN